MVRYGIVMVFLHQVSMLTLLMSGQMNLAPPQTSLDLMEYRENSLEPIKSIPWYFIKIPSKLNTTWFSLLFYYSSVLGNPLPMALPSKTLQDRVMQSPQMPLAPQPFVPWWLRWWSRTYGNIHTYIHTYIPTYVHTYIHTYIHMYIYIYIGWYTCGSPLEEAATFLVISAFTVPSVLAEVSFDRSRLESKTHWRAQRCGWWVKTQAMKKRVILSTADKIHVVDGSILCSSRSWVALRRSCRTSSPSMILASTASWYGGFLSHGGTPSHHPLIDGIFHYTPATTLE